MKNLEKISGLPISLDEKNLDLIFNGDFPSLKKTERSLEDLKPYLKNPESEKGADPAYYVWHAVHLKRDDERLKNANLRYDLTLIPAGKIGNEFLKTAGHYHQNGPNPDFSYPEAFEVLSGRAYFLIQSPMNAPERIASIKIAEVGSGEKFIVPPDFSGHNIINVFDEPLLVANLASSKAEPNYDIYKNNHGASYYLTANQNMIDMVKNEKYGPVPEIKKVRAKDYPEFGIITSRPLYALVSDIEKLEFLNRPEKFNNSF